MIPIILQTFGRLEYTMQVISSIHNNILYANKIVIVDNGSTDGTVEYLQLMLKLGHIHHLILNETNLGIAIPKNQALDVVKEWAKTEDIKYIVISDNDIVPPFSRDSEGKCALEHMVQIMDNHLEIGMCGVDLNKDNAPSNQAWWWKLRQHPASNPEFAEIAVGFWFAIVRLEIFNDFSFVGESSYGKVDESLRNFLYLVKKQKVGIWKGVHNYKIHETVPSTGIHIGWSEDYSKFPDYVNMKKAERAKAEKVWREKNRKW